MDPADNPANQSRERDVGFEINCQHALIIFVEKNIMLEAYHQHLAERAAMELPPLPLSAKQVAELVELLKQPESAQNKALLNLLVNCVPPGVDQAAYVKASFLAAVAKKQVDAPLI